MRGLFKTIGVLQVMLHGVSCGGRLESVSNTSVANADADSSGHLLGDCCDAGGEQVGAHEQSPAEALDAGPGANTREMAPLHGESTQTDSLVDDGVAVASSTLVTTSPSTDEHSEATPVATTSNSGAEDSDGGAGRAEPNPGCGDGVLAREEACDDGNTETEVWCPRGLASCVACSRDCTETLELHHTACQGSDSPNNMCQRNLSIAAGAAHTCVVLSGDDGEVWCWGRGTSGQLGDGEQTSRSVPVKVASSSPLRNVAAGNAHTCAVTKEWEVECWGDNSFGQIGTELLDVTVVPAPVTGIGGVQVLAVGGDVSCAMLLGHAACWGRGDRGQLGIGDTANQSAPVKVEHLADKVTLSVGQGHVCAGSPVRCWGQNDHGQIGNGTTENSAATVLIDAVPSNRGLSAGGAHTCALLASGELMCWGAGAAGQLGNGDFDDQLVPATTVANLGGIPWRVSAGGSHTCAALTDGTVKCWGAGASGQLGNGLTENQAEPVTVQGITTAIEVASGDEHTCALLSEGKVLCWGAGAEGRLGNDGNEGSATPVEVVGF